MSVDSSSRGSVVWQNQQARHGGRLPSMLARYVAAKPALAIETREHRLEIRDHGLDLDDQQRPCRRMKSENVDRASFATDIERNLGCGFPVTRVQQRDHKVDEGCVSRIEQSIETLALPQESEVDPGT